MLQDDLQFIIAHLTRLPQFSNYAGRVAFIQSTGQYASIQPFVDLQGPAFDVATNVINAIVSRDDPEALYQFLVVLAQQYGETSSIRRQVEEIAAHIGNRPQHIGALVNWPATETPQEIQEKFYGSPLYPVEFLQRGFQRARAVALIQLDGLVGTGVLITESLLLTCKHVVASAAVAAAAQFIFNYEDNAAPAQPYHWNGPGSYWQSDTHDIAVMELAGNPGQTWGVAPLSQSTPQAEEYIHLVHHALGAYKRVSLGAAIKFVRPDTLGYLATTMPGSSGAPVFNNAWEVVAIHRGSEPAKQWPYSYSHNVGTPILAFRDALPPAWLQRLNG